MARKYKKESAFQSEVIHELKRRWPGCVVMKNMTGAKDGFPDITVYIGAIWAMLECKRSKNAPHRPNQDWWVDNLNRMGFARFIFPENRKEVMRDLERYVKRMTKVYIFKLLERKSGCAA